MRLQNRVAMITGGGSGIGEAIARKFAAEGAKVVVADSSVVCSAVEKKVAVDSSVDSSVVAKAAKAAVFSVDSSAAAKESWVVS